MSKLFIGLSGWDWLEIISLGAVSAGAICALILRSRKSTISPGKNGLIPVTDFFEKEKIESQKHRWELFWELLLIAGLIGEIPATKHSISESARLNNENLVLQTNVVALQLKLQWRTISPTQEEHLIKLLKPIVDAFPQKDRKVFITLEPPADKEEWSFGNRLFDVLKKCDFDVESKLSTSIPNFSGFPLPKEFEDNLVLIGLRGGGVTSPPFSSLVEGLAREGIIGGAKVYGFPGEPPSWFFSDNQLWILVLCKNEK